MEISSALLKHGSDVNAKDSHLRTPLHYAACRNRPVYLQWLLSHEADPEVKDIHNRTMLHAASLSGQVENATLLLKVGCPFSDKDIWDFTAKDLARVRAFASMTKALTEYEKKENINISTNNELDSLKEVVINTLISGLKEQKETQMKRCVHRLGCVICLEIFQKAIETEQKGGMLTEDKSRRKTAGGVFLSILKEKVIRNEISRSDWEYIRHEEKELHLIRRNRRSKAKSQNDTKPKCVQKGPLRPIRPSLSLPLAPHPFYASSSLPPYIPTPMGVSPPVYPPHMFPLAVNSSFISPFSSPGKNDVRTRPPCTPQNPTGRKSTIKENEKQNRSAVHRRLPPKGQNERRK
ncbi:ankyrin repeat-containing protein [Cardiosporidium cionae]|uniref:Ankyrin repeat-containing protein n=1 Tax=Cardiosporidium cionae TaxID=476202 RepID=A0ABQ7JAT7_9APIC|nr:ankyrin repeat-containing protein [Cardiosporidium cionae]|eukprot:KAF8821106.1 ankyrin repeat-containing protein [Cardiosporidium cionae]